MSTMQLLKTSVASKDQAVMLTKCRRQNNHTDAQKGQVTIGSVLQVEMRILGTEMLVIEANVVLRLDAAMHCSKDILSVC